MDYMKLLYRILKLARGAMDTEEIPPASEIYLPGVLKASENAIESMICKAYEEGYIKGVRAIEIDGLTKPKVLLDQSHITITIKGLEYLADNSLMQKVGKILKGVKEVTPGV